MFHHRLAARDARQRKEDALRRLQDEVAALRVHNRELSTSLGGLLAQARPWILGVQGVHDEVDAHKPRAVHFAGGGACAGVRRHGPMSRHTPLGVRLAHSHLENTLIYSKPTS